MDNLEKKINNIADVFPILRTPKKVVNQISKKTPLIGLFGKQHVRRTEHCWNLNNTTFTIFIDQCERTWSWKNCLLVTCKVLRLFLNILAAHDKYSVLNRDSLRQPVQMQLCQKQKAFLNLFQHFWKLH